MKADLHMHSTYSDGSMSITGLAEQAKKAGLQVIGITDHIGKGIYYDLRLPMFLAYINEIDSANRDGLVVLRGLEVSGVVGLDLLSRSQIRKLDYLLFENCEKKVAELNRIRKEIRRPVGLAHPDFSRIDRDNLGDVFVELNTGYLVADEEEIAWNNFRDFWLSVGSDTHIPSHLGETDRFQEIIEKYGLKFILDREDFKRKIRIARKRGKRVNSQIY